MQVRIERLLAGTALAVVLSAALPAMSANAQSAPASETSATTEASAPAQPAPSEPAKAQPAAEPAPQAAAAPAAPAASETPAPAQAAAPAPAVAPAPVTVANSAVADKLREAISAQKAERMFNRRSDRLAAEEFYKKRDFAPLWVANGSANVAEKAAADYLAHVDRDGLDPSEYPVPSFANADAESLADAELKMTAAVMTYAYHALHGRVHFSRVSADIDFANHVMEPGEVLAALANAKDMSAALDGFEPQFSEYKQLRKALAAARSGKTETKKAEEPAKPAVRVAAGKILRPGMKDARVIALRKRLEITANADSNLYDKDVQAAVKKFQEDAGIGADGNLGANTVAALNGDHEKTAEKIGDPVDTIIVNLDRWRWYPRDLGSTHVVVNIPDYRLTIFKDEKVYWTTKIVAGQPSKPTPLISADMKFITVNPTWNVPPSIIEKEYLPALREDPQALDRIGLKVSQAPDGTVRIWQPPGARNALGRIRFNFPNKFLVYQHDTPDKHLFARDKRAFSHGCMRVENPLMYGEKILSLALPNENYTAARIEKMFGGSEINLNFPKVIPVHLTYQTAFVDGDGKLQLREDVYGRDARHLAILKGSERKVADISVERAPNTSARPVRLAPGSLGGESADSGPSFFDFLFGGARRDTIPPARRRYDNNGRVSSR